MSPWCPYKPGSTVPIAFQYASYDENIYKKISFTREQFVLDFSRRPSPFRLFVEERHNLYCGPFYRLPSSKIRNHGHSPTPMYFLKIGLNVLNAVLLIGVFPTFSNCQL